MRKVVMIAAMLTLPVVVHAQLSSQTPMQPVPKIRTAPPVLTPEWYKDVTQLQKRIVQLEAELASLKQEYAGHTHIGYRAELVWKNEHCESYDHPKKDDPDYWDCAQIIKWNPLSQMTTSTPVSGEPFKPVY